VRGSISVSVPGFAVDHPIDLPPDSELNLCPHNVVDGDKPDPWIGGRLKCAECRMAHNAGRTP